MSEPTKHSPERRPLPVRHKRALDAMFLPELHQSQWAQRMGELHDVQRQATTPEAEAAAKAAIMAHYKSRHDVEATRQRLEQEYQVQEAVEQSKEP